MGVVRAMRMASSMRTLRAVAAGLRGGHYGSGHHYPELNEQIARYLDGQADDSRRKLLAFEAQGGFERARARHGGNR